MSDKKYPITYNKGHYTVMANDVIKGKQEMTLQEARLLRLLITQVVKEDKDLKTYTVKISELAEFLKVPKNNLYRDIKGVCNSLLQRIVHIGTGNPKEPWKSFQWIQLAEYDGNGTLTLMLSNQIKPFVIELDKYFTQYKLTNILEMDSFYALRIYELIKGEDHKYKEYQEYTVEFLRQCCGCENKYKEFYNFKARVIDTAIKEINGKTDLEIREIQYIKKGRAVVGLRFLVWDNYRNSKQLPGQLDLEGNEVENE